MLRDKKLYTTYNKGDIVVRTTFDLNRSFTVGDMGKVIEDRGAQSIWIEKMTGAVSKNRIRLANTIEIIAFNNGIKNIKDITPESLKTNLEPLITF